MPRTTIQVILYLFLAGCTSMGGKTSSGGEFYVYRFATDAAIQVGADGSMSFSSAPAEFVQGQLIQALLQALQANAKQAEAEEVGSMF